MTQKQTVQIAEAKGRPMLHWVGKRPLDYVAAFPAQLVERFDPAGELQTSEVSETSEVSGNLLFHGDNKDVLAWLLAHGYRGKVNLIYIDPPFDSGADYVRRVQLRGVSGTARLEGEAHSLGEQIQYTDIWANDMYLQFMYERLLLLKELLVESGGIWLHCDYHKGHYLKCLCDEIFSESNFVTEVIWKRSTPRGNVKKGLSVAHDIILVYSKGPDPKWHPPLLEYSEDYIARFTNTDPDGRRYTLDSLISPNPDRPNLDYVWKGVRKVWRVTKQRMQEYEAQGRLEYTSRSVARYKRYLDELEGRPLTTLWDDIFPVNSQAVERVDYPTQKPEALVERIIKTSSDPGDLVLDCFVGSGTTAAIAQKLGRRWIAADVNKGAIQTTSKRLQAIIREQIKTSEVSETSEVSPSPAALSFSVCRVNDYDLQIQHNEAVNLAVELVGIERIKTDTFFDGTLGRRLVKIVPFNHPLTLLDLQLLQDELKARPDEERDIVVVCLGQETAVDPWLEEYNKRRPINKIEVIELRTDQKYGKFFVHQPAQAQVHIERQDGNIVVEIEDFISPTIVERLEMDTPLFKAQIPDWRAMVDVVLIDTAYDGEVFNIALSDVPERKNDLVSGHYELAAPDGPSTVAVKIIDMLGEEVLVTAEV
ncbi:MAG: site-specific DNA-methyltransferase [Anaerolineales bacterium]|nr:MAG: site-specific DNA-methyltransferase [Anaerolineales bacterium]